MMLVGSGSSFHIWFHQDTLTYLSQIFPLQIDVKAS